jgi:outer membrane protein OmpA-like peptidoglycan-associated protein
VNWKTTNDVAVRERLRIDREAATPTIVPAPAAGASPVVPVRPYRKHIVSLGPKFDMEGEISHDPPAADELLVTHRVKFDFRDLTGDRISQWDPAWRPSQKDLDEGKWTEPEKQAFRQDFFRTISVDWSGKHQFRLVQPEYLQHLCNLKVKVAADDAQPHSTITVHKRLPPHKRIRSFVQGPTAQLDSRDNHTDDNSSRRSILVQPFPHNSADISTLGPQLDEAAAKVKRRTRTPPTTEDEGLTFIGGTTSSGTTTRNSALQQQRAEAVRQAIGQRLGWSKVGNAGEMERRSGTSPEFRNVLIVLPMMRAQQRTSSHEFGHLIGLGDEYEEGDERQASDPSTHYEATKREMGTDAAEEMRVVNDDDIMSVGSGVRRGHYLPFLQSLKGVTGLHWEVL